MCFGKNKVFFLLIADCGAASDVAGATKVVEKFVDITESLSVESVVRYSCAGDKFMVPPSKPISCNGGSWNIYDFECLPGNITFYYIFDFKVI